MTENPYKNRDLPVGPLSFSIKEKWEPKLWRGAMLEFGEEELIFSMAERVGGGSLLNLGDAEGGSAILLAQGLKFNNLKGLVYTIDNYDDKACKFSSKNYGIAEVEDKIIKYRGATTYWADWLKDRLKFNFIFIDADHSYEGVKSDWLGYNGLLEPEGLIAFHDTNQHGPNNVIKEELQDWNLVEWVNRIKVFQRK